jgi:hypothetical protein
MTAADQLSLQNEMKNQRKELVFALPSNVPVRLIDIIQQFVPVVLPNVQPVPYVPLTEEQKSKLKPTRKMAHDCKPRPKKDKHVFRMVSK